MSTPEVRIVIPACNEEERISSTIREYCEHFGDRARIVVVANGCEDGTEQVVESFQQRYPNLALIAINARIGKGGAVRAGFSSGVESLVGFTDADGSTSPREFDRLVAHLREFEADGVIGSRWMHGAIMQRPQPLMRRIASRIFNGLVRVLFRLPYRDTQCGAKVFTRQAIEQIFPQLEVSNFAFDVDLLYRLRKAQRAVLESPIIWAENFQASTVRLATASWSMLFAILRLRLRDSLFGHVPFFEYVARRSVIPVKESFHLLVLGTLKEHPRDVDDYTEQMALGWGDAGHSVQWLQTSNFWWRLRIAVWYALFGRREFDAVIEVASGIPYFIPAFSVKPCFLVVARRMKPESTSARLYRRWYSRVPRITGDRSPAVEARAIIAQIKSSGLYVALFDRQDGNWSLTVTGTQPSPAKHEQL